jgi:DNA-binding MarR family transcriptional regulator
VTIPLPDDPPIDVSDVVDSATHDPIAVVEDVSPVDVSWTESAIKPEDLLSELPTESEGPTAGAGAATPPLLLSPGGAVTVSVQMGAAVAAAAYASEGARWREWRDAIPFATLFSRLRRERLLDHPVRERIYEAIRANAGIYYRELLRTLGVSNGTLAFHLHHLERAGYVRARRVRGRKHLYPTGFRPEPRDALVTPSQRRILAYLQIEPGASQREIMRAVGLKRSTVSYQIGVLRSLGLVETRRVGSETRCFPRDL